jgi:hypothetical protein
MSAAWSVAARAIVEAATVAVVVGGVVSEVAAVAPSGGGKVVVDVASCVLGRCVLDAAGGAVDGCCVVPQPVTISARLTPMVLTTWPIHRVYATGSCSATAFAGTASTSGVAIPQRAPWRGASGLGRIEVHLEVDRTNA